MIYYDGHYHTPGIGEQSKWKNLWNKQGVSYLFGDNDLLTSYLTIFWHFVDTSWDRALRSIIIFKTRALLQTVQWDTWSSPYSSHIQTVFEATQLLKVSLINWSWAMPKQRNLPRPLWRTLPPSSEVQCHWHWWHSGHWAWRMARICPGYYWNWRLKENCIHALSMMSHWRVHQVGER